MTLVERYRDRLQALELERLKVLRDRQTYRFLTVLLAFLGACSLIAGTIGTSKIVVFLGFALVACAYGVWQSRKTLAEAYQIKFREQITREWFQERFRSAYLAPAPETISEEFRVAIREAAIRATDQNPDKTVIEERILFERDMHTSLIFVLREGPALKAKSRALVWCKIRSDDKGLVAFVWPPAFPTQKKPDLRFFENGKRTGIVEPLATKLEALYETAQRVALGCVVRVGFAPRGVFLGCRLPSRIFAAPVDKSVFELDSYEHWEKDAQLALSQELRGQINSIF